MKRLAILVGFGFSAVGLVAETEPVTVTLVGQAQGEVVEFIVSSTFAEDFFAGDVVVFTGRSQGTVAVGDCDVDGEGPLQSAVVLDPGEQRATRNKEIVVTSRDTAVRPGTRVGSLHVLGNCHGTQFVKVQGIVE